MIGGEDVCDDNSFKSLKKISPNLGAFPTNWLTLQEMDGFIILGFITSKKNIMLTTTTPQVDGRPIRQYLGVVSAETIIGANFLKDFLANLTDFFGGRSNTYEKVLRQGKDTVMQELQMEATKLGANAIVGIDIDYNTVGGNGSMLMVVGTGTAVVL